MKCEVFCCPNRRRKTRGKSFFRFPRDKETADLWLKEIGREGATINDNRFVCEDHFENSYIFQWKDRKVIDKEATPFHDYRACPICSDPNKNEEDVHPGNKKRNKEPKPKKVKPIKVKSKLRDACSSGSKSHNVVLQSSEDFVKEEIEDVETFIATLEITPLSYTDIPDINSANDLVLNEDTENAYQNVEILAEDEMEIKQAKLARGNEITEVIVENKSNLLSNNFLDPDLQECSASLSESEAINFIERVKGICRICLANYFKGQSIFLFYKNKYLPHIVHNLTGNLPKRDDELPAMVCFTCADLLLQAEAARKRCIYSDKFLRQELQKKKNEMKSVEIFEPQNEGLNQNIQPNENNVAATVIPYKQSSFNVTKEHNYMNFGNKKEKIKNIRVKKTKTLEIEDILNIKEDIFEPEESSNKTEGSPNIKDENLNLTEPVPYIKEEQFLEAQYLDDPDADILYEDLFSETNVQYKEDVELSTDSVNPDPLGMGIILPELFLCTVCSRKIPSLRAFRRHQRYHNSVNFRCPICPEELTPQTIKDHLYTHKERQELICADCGKHFDDIVDLYNHIMIHARSYRKLLYIHECEICHKTTPSLASHLNHMKKKHNIQVRKPFQCQKCGIRFTAKLGLQRHEDNIHNLENRLNREKKFLCSTCGRKFFTKGTLQVHIRSHTGERPYKCKYCGKTFSQINSVTVHTYIHTGEKPFICSICGKRFKQYSHYDYHRLIHADKRPHVCKICNRAFRVRGTLNTHMKIHGNRPFRCEPCNRGYPERSGLNKHMKKHHSDEWNKPAIREEELVVSPYDNINLDDITQEEIEWARTDKGCSTSSIYSDDERVDEFCENQHLKEVITSLKVDPLKCVIDEIPVEGICNEHTTNVTNVVDKKPETVKIIDKEDENSTHNFYEEPENVAQENRSSPHEMTNCVEYIHGSCRVCLTNCFNGQSIFKYYKKKFLPNIILILTGIHVNKGDELPSMICFSCANLLLQAESIRNMCLTSDKFLKLQKEFKIKIDEDVSRHKVNLEERSTEYTSINLCRDTGTNSTQKQSIPSIDLMEANVVKEKIQSDIEVKEVFRNQVHCDEKYEKITEDHHNVESLDNDIEDQHCDEERLEEEIEDQYQGKEILDDEKADQLLDDKYDDEDFRLNNEFSSFDENDSNNDFDGKAFEIFECNICSKQFEDKKCFDQHRRTHLQKKRKCPVCPKKLTYRAMQLHLATHKEINKLICDQCGDVFNNALILFNHLKQHKTNVKRRDAKDVYRCEICEYESFALPAYKTHMKNIHDLEVPKPFKCKQCHVRFTRKDTMNRHIDNIHKRNPPKRIKDFLCNICGKNFYVKYHLEVHMRTHTGERPHKCNYCSKSFTQSSALRSHEHIHTGEKPFACKHCGKKFKQYGHLAYHQQTHAKGFPYTCKICHHKFKIRANLNVHMKLHSKREFSCKICQKAYVWPCKLKEHIRKSHPGVQASELEDTVDVFEES